MKRRDINKHNERIVRQLFKRYKDSTRRMII